MGKKTGRKDNGSKGSSRPDEGSSASTDDRAQGRSHARGTKGSKATERDERRRDKALERICAQSASAVLPSMPGPSVSPPHSVLASDQISLDQHDVNVDSSQLWGGPSITGRESPQVVTEIQAGTGSAQDPGLAPVDPSMTAQMQSFMAAAIQKGIAEGMRQMEARHSKPRASSPFTAPTEARRRPAARHRADSSSEDSGDSSLEMSDEGPKDLELSEDEGRAPEPPAISGLFQPALYRSLLFKAKSSAKLTPAATTDTAQQPLSMFVEPTMELDVVPAPQIFQDAVLRQWDNPNSGPTPSSSDKKFFNIEAVLADALKPPTIDAPVAAVYSATTMPGDAAELLKPEDRRTEQALIKNHQSAAWAVKASTTASFFARTSLLWLQQLQEKLPASDTRLRQDINKLLAAAQFTADATLQSARFASRAIGSSVVARRMHWLRSWQADTRHKWRLACSPFKGQKLFGEALDPILIETKDKRKILPTHSKKTNFRTTPYYRKPFRSPEQSTSYQRPAGQYTQYTPKQRQGQDRQTRGKQFRRPFRGGGGRPFRRSRY